MTEEPSGPNRVKAILHSFLARKPPRPRIIEADPIGDAIRDLAEGNGISPAELRQAIRDQLRAQGVSTAND